MNKVAISSACKCLSIAPRQTTITKTTTKRVTQVSTKISHCSGDIHTAPEIGDSDGDGYGDREDFYFNRA
ncbi:hypothetical protein E4T52_12006 [Aureobasidium sp. EXF-3400]|nr:hypothetical protein E4T51_11037 [Aureobasidium sp. EXF-12344]KAI4773022.1 hypothetical protein E4T52_12006 [Aureobasidium sp. EXF-3400]